MRVEELKEKKKYYDYALLASTEIEQQEIIEFMMMHDYNLISIGQNEVVCSAIIRGKSYILIRSDQGSDSAFETLVKVWSEYTFGCLIASGICYAFPEKSEIGDILIFKNTYDYDTIKYVKGDDEMLASLTKSFTPSKKSCTQLGEKFIRNFLQMNKFFSFQKENEYININTGKKIYIGNQVCSKAVVNDHEKFIAIRDLLEENIGGFYCGDMESLGVYKFFEEYDIKIPVIIVKSVVDLGGNKGKENKHYTDSIEHKNGQHEKRHIQRIAMNIVLDLVFNIIWYNEECKRIDYLYDNYCIFGNGKFNAHFFLDNLFENKFYSSKSKESVQNSSLEEDKENLSSYFKTFLSFENYFEERLKDNIFDELINLVYLNTHYFYLTKEIFAG